MSGARRCTPMLSLPVSLLAAFSCARRSSGSTSISPRAAAIIAGKHEVCWYAVRDGNPSHWQGDRTQTTVWEIADNNGFANLRPENGGEHATSKPIECMRRPIVNNSRPGEAIYDPFLGSGSSVIAAEMSGRVCYGIELNPAYVDVAVRRWQVFTGRVARHQASGQSFDEHGTRHNHAP